CRVVHALTESSTAGHLPAKAIATIGQLPYLGQLQWKGPVEPPAANSAFRLAQVQHRYSVPISVPQHGPVLLIDDVANTRWSMTVATTNLRAAGGSGVLPLTLALGQLVLAPCRAATPWLPDLLLQR